LEKNISTEKHEANIHTSITTKHTHTQRKRERHTHRHTDTQTHIRTCTSLQETEFTEGKKDTERKERGEGAEVDLEVSIRQEGYVGSGGEGG
jgi:hypothetical protein